MEEFKNIREAIDRLLNVKSAIKRKKQTKQVQEKELFINIINSLQTIQARSNLTFSELQLDLSTYDELFLQVIDSLLLLNYGRDAYELIIFYLWERVNPDGSINDIHDEEDNVIPLNNVNDLWNTLLQLKKS